MKISVTRLLPGMMVDLKDDLFADPYCNNWLFECELVEVCLIAQETPRCIVIGFENFGLVGFPNHHKLNIRRIKGVRELNEISRDITDEIIRFYGPDSLTPRLRQWARI